MNKAIAAILAISFLAGCSSTAVEETATTIAPKTVIELTTTTTEAPTTTTTEEPTTTTEEPQREQRGDNKGEEAISDEDAFLVLAVRVTMNDLGFEAEIDMLSDADIMAISVNSCEIATASATSDELVFALFEDIPMSTNEREFEFIMTTAGATLGVYCPAEAERLGLFDEGVTA